MVAILVGWMAARDRAQPVPGSARASLFEPLVDIELSERWASLAEPLRALMAEVEREGHADRTTPPISLLCRHAGRG